ncbi:MAG: hypothetical protein LBE76_01455 [Nitrososphaerota archaeon]|nr:hypothetical protein [Nitrososphaerota archaeon]
MGRVRRGKQKHVAKKNSQSLVILVFVCIAIAVVVGAIVIFNGLSEQESDVRVFTAGSQIVSLYDDGVFSAQLAHSVAKSGTYSESVVGDVTTVIFMCDGKTEEGSIVGNVLTLPGEWGDGHGHGSKFILSNS